MRKVLGYKVRHTQTKLFLSSVSRGKWTAVGKTWPRKGDAVRSINNGLKRLRSGWPTGQEYEQVLNDLPLWEFVELEETLAYSALFLLDKIKT
jgi:hypothetical protein